jgi:hypothetical protein
MKKVFTGIVLFLTAGVVCAAASPASFAGKWNFDPQQSRNIGMMAGGKIHTSIKQSDSKLVVDDHSLFNAQEDDQHTVYDLTGKAATNSSMMAAHATTRSHWDGSRLVTEWESPGAIAGTTTKRIETRYLSTDGKTMFVESARAGKEPMVIVFTREK